MKLSLPPLSLYIHIPWCVQKCPYCDFNSHTHKSELPEMAYVACLLDDLKRDTQYLQGREIESIFFGGGTPSILSVEAISKLMIGVRNTVKLAENCEITLEANPGTVEAAKFAGFKQAGINRISIGVQSLQSSKLEKLGRIHNPDEALNAADLATNLDLNSFNLDLMHGLPDQSLEDALADLTTAIDKKPPHISWYQLTIEPNTLFGSKPPVLPEDETLWAIQEQGQALLAKHGYEQYEISAYRQVNQDASKTFDHRCRHNLNYWRYGDYIGIGCGAHGKITLAESGEILRTEKVKHPTGYLDLTKDYLFKQHLVPIEERSFDYFINRCRLFEPIPKAEFISRTGLTEQDIEPFINQAVSKGLMENTEKNWQVTSQGYRYLNELLSMLL
ncbi:radical SAM family heme chaperone HemW [Catenovulum sp. SM1970]|uniref:radical SAM family heme chaperone HemW n=1 Tax=Marinifaba aquimaris TaxID=2741323 RepID=UPI0015740F49|nr:radical SAM family heme chaperone HemW [Marinifaba aquimaris]NTS76434.1 radical SAM family heme chaperone HemW [Marinifaba aquimaris]